MPETGSHESRCGLVALIGRPNVGKSTLLNRLLGQKLSITSNKPQTTRHRILGVVTDGACQAVYVDTPGIHSGQRRALNRYLNRTAAGALDGVDLALFMVEGERWTDEDQHVLALVQRAGVPALCVVNKVDRVRPRERLLPVLQQLAERARFVDLVPLSARSGENVEPLQQRVHALLPPGEHLFDEDAITDRSLRFLCAEILREKLMRNLAQELPYSCTVEIETFEETAEHTHIGALVWVERASHKGIVIGRQGTRMREMASDARQDMERLLQRQVFLEVWVKVKSGWTDDELSLRTLGYDDR